MDRSEISSITWQQLCKKRTEGISKWPFFWERALLISSGKAIKGLTTSAEIWLRLETMQVNGLFQMDSKATLNACIAQMVWWYGTCSDCCLSLLCCLLSPDSGSPTTHCPYAFSIELEWVCNFWTFLQKCGSREVQSKPQLISPFPFHLPLVAIHLSPEKCCRIICGLAACRAGQPILRRARETGQVPEIPCIFILCPGVGSPEDREVPSPSVRWGQLGEKSLVWKVAALSKAMMVLQH